MLWTANLLLKHSPQNLNDPKSMLHYRCYIWKQLYSITSAGNYYFLLSVWYRGKAVGGWAQSRVRIFLYGVTYSKVGARQETDDLIFHQTRRNVASGGGSHSPAAALAKVAQTDTEGSGSWE